MTARKIVGQIVFCVSLFVSAQAHAARSPALNCNNDGRCTTLAAPTQTIISAPRRAANVRVEKSRRQVGQENRHSGLATIVSKKTGAKAQVGSDNASAMQAYVDDLESAGGIVILMHGWRKERCAPPRHKHACGGALDVCQTARDVVMAKCHLPPRASMIALAARHGLTEGGQWCSGDRGHVEAGASAGACGVRVARRGDVRGTAISHRVAWHNQRASFRSARSHRISRRASGRVFHASYKQRPRIARYP